MKSQTIRHNLVTEQQQKKIFIFYHLYNRSNSFSPYLSQRRHLLPKARSLSLWNMSQVESFLMVRTIPSSLYFPPDLTLCLVNKLAFLGNDQWMSHVLTWTRAFQRRQNSTEGISIIPSQALLYRISIFLFLDCISVLAFNPNKITNLFYCDSFLNIKYLASYDLNSIIYSHKLLSTFHGKKLMHLMQEMCSHLFASPNINCILCFQLPELKFYWKYLKQACLSNIKC